MRTSWYELLKEEFEVNGDDFSKMITTLENEYLHEEFNNHSECVQGTPFLAWGENFVYFPVQCYGWEEVGSVPRNPCDEPVSHFGGS